MLSFDNLKFKINYYISENEVKGVFFLNFKSIVNIEYKTCGIYVRKFKTYGSLFSKKKRINQAIIFFQLCPHCSSYSA